MGQKVALVLSSGGARGFAHIGAIEELEAQGFEITSVAGTSMGALIGGLYASGQLEQAKDWMFTRSTRQMLSLVDMSLGRNHLVKGEKVIKKFEEVVPDAKIEDLPTSFCAVATDVKNSKEVVFDTGSLYNAIRASISIPAFFSPVKYNGGVLVDGGVINPIPLNRVKRTQGDILVAINVSGRDCHDLHELKRVAISRRDQKKSLLPTIPDVSALIKQQIKEEKEHPDRNYFSLLSKSFSLMIQQNGALSLQLTPPDILIDIPMNKYGSFDYDKAEAISKMGRVEMKKALEEYKLRTQR